jgi:hypothetical protein
MLINGWALNGSILGRSSIKIANLVLIRQQTWPPQAILVSYWLISKKSSSLKPLCQINQNMVARLRFIWQSGFRGEDLKKSANQKQEFPMVAMFVNGSERNEHSL